MPHGSRLPENLKPLDPFCIHRFIISLLKIHWIIRYSSTRVQRSIDHRKCQFSSGKCQKLGVPKDAHSGTLARTLAHTTHRETTHTDRTDHITERARLQVGAQQAVRVLCWQPASRPLPNAKGACDGARKGGGRVQGLHTDHRADSVDEIVRHV